MTARPHPGRMAAWLVACLWAIPALAQPNAPPPLAVSAPADLSGSVLRVEGVGEDDLEVAPGAVFTAVFRVTNTSDLERAVTAALEVAPGWESVLPLRPFTVAGGGHDLRIVSVQVPGDAAPGAYDVRYHAEEGDGSAAGAVRVTVPRVHALALDLEDVPPWTASGTPYTIRGLLLNTGNAPADVVLEVASNTNAPVRLDARRAVLEPGALYRFEIVATPETAVPLRHVVRVSARVDGAPGTVVYASAVTSVIPITDQIAERGRRLDAEIAVRGVQSVDGPGGQVELGGAVPLGGGVLEGAFVVPDRDVPGAYRDRSQYSVRFARPSLEAVVGDHVFALSPLTEAGQYGFGAGGEIATGGITAGGFVHRRRYSAVGGNAGGAFVGWRVTPGAEIRANVFRRDDFRAGDVVSVRGLLTPSGTLALDAECGLGTGTTRACSGRLQVERPWLSVRTTAVDADPGFPGRHHDVRVLSNSVVVRPARSVQVEGSYQDHRRGETASNLVTRAFHIGTGWTASRSNGAQVSLRWGGREVGQAGATREERSGRLVTGYSLGPVGVRGGAEVGHVRGRLGEGEAPFQRYHGRIRVAGSAGSVSLGLERRRGGSLYGTLERDEWRGDVGIGFEVASRTRLSLNASASLDRTGATSTGRTYAYAQGRLDHTLPSGHRIEVEGRHISTSGAFATRRTEYTAAYVVPLRVGIGRRVGEFVAGRVYDAETGAGLPYVVVSLGTHTAITDEDGRFSLPRPDQTTALEVDRVTAGIDRVPLGGTSLVVPAGTGPLPDLEVPMVRGARLTGAFRVDLEAETPPIRQAVVEIEGAGGRLRAVSDRDGRFAFEGVAPGAWTLRVVHADLPRHHAVERETYAVALSPGGAGHVEVEVKPRRREIRLIDSGTVSTRRPAGGPEER